jgi:hypothetical protein
LFAKVAVPGRDLLHCAELAEIRDRALLVAEQHAPKWT